MATSYANYTGGSNTTSAIYTVPTGKVAKLIITNLEINVSQSIQIGAYRKDNGSGYILYTRINSYASTGTPNTNYLETEDIIVPRRAINSFASQCMMMKRSHILLAGENIRFLGADAGNNVSFTVIEEDV